IGEDLIHRAHRPFRPGDLTQMRIERRIEVHAVEPDAGAGRPHDFLVDSAQRHAAIGLPQRAKRILEGDGDTADPTPAPEMPCQLQNGVLQDLVAGALDHLAHDVARGGVVVRLEWLHARGPGAEEAARKILPGIDAEHVAGRHQALEADRVAVEPALELMFFQLLRDAAQQLRILGLQLHRVVPLVCYFLSSKPTLASAMAPWISRRMALSAPSASPAAKAL